MHLVRCHASLRVYDARIERCITEIDFDNCQISPAIDLRTDRELFDVISWICHVILEAYDEYSGSLDSQPHGSALMRDSTW